MFKRLVVLVLLAIATLSVSTPARASALTIDRLFCQPEYQAAECQVRVSGGTGVYSYYWSNRSRSDGTIIRCAVRYQYQEVSVIVTDSSGAMVIGTTYFYCTR